MRIRPTGNELVPAAQAVLEASIAPQIPAAEQRGLHDVEAALALALRVLESDAPPRRDDLERLQSARARLRTEILARLPKKTQYDARLVAKVLSIATNQLAEGLAPERAELDRLASLLNETAPAQVSATEVRGRLALLSAQLCADIRAGRADPGTAPYAATYAHLRETTRQAVSESNPAYLQHRANPARAPKDSE
jgi:hypothetical protein